jgi:small subunit ribosomal protein S2
MTSLRCIQVIAGVLGRAGQAGQKLREEAALRGKITYSPATDLRVPGEGEEEAATPSATRDAAIPAAAAHEEHVELADREALGNDEELAAKLEDEATHDGRKLGHRVKISD